MPTQGDYSQYDPVIVEAWKTHTANLFWQDAKQEEREFRLFMLGWNYHAARQQSQPANAPIGPTQETMDKVISYLAMIGANTTNIVFGMSRINDTLDSIEEKIDAANPISITPDEGGTSDTNAA